MEFKGLMWLLGQIKGIFVDFAEKANEGSENDHTHVKPANALTAALMLT